MERESRPGTGRAPAFQLYAKEFFCDTADLRSCEVGAHIRAIVWSWNRGPLPRDDDRRRRVCMADETEWPAIWSAIATLWRETTDGFLNDMVEQRRRDQAEFRGRQRENGLKGGRPRREPNANPESPNPKPTGNPAVTQTKPLHSALCTLHSAPSDLRPADCDLRPSDQLRARTNRALAVTYPADFQAFWQAYPKRTGKGDALKVWTMLRPDAEMVNVIVTALGWQRSQPEWARDGGKYTPNPATWLRARRWEDEPFQPPADLELQRADTIGVHNVKVLMQARAVRAARERPGRLSQVLMEEINND